MTKLIILYLVNNSVYEILTVQIIVVVSVSFLDSDTVDLGWGQRFCILTTFKVMPIAGPWTRVLIASN